MLCGHPAIHRGSAIAASSEATQPRVTPPAPAPEPRGLQTLNPATRAVLRSRRSDPADLRGRISWPVLLAAILLHGLILWAVWMAMRPSQLMPPTQRREQVLQVRFINTPRVVAPPPALAAPPPLPQQHLPAPAAKPPARKPTPPAAITHAPPSSTGTALQLYGRTGAARLPASATSSTTVAVPGYVQRMPQGDTRIMRHTSPIPYKPTRFEQYFPPPGETLGGALVRHVVQAVVKSTDVDLPKGVHLKCTTVLGVPIPNCINPPAPPSKKDGDERLSMAPAKPLAVDPHALPPPGVAACIAMYRAGKPLAWGCPVDTPDRSVDQELREHPARATTVH
jgi:hypothetical protein